MVYLSYFLVCILVSIHSFSYTSAYDVVDVSNDGATISCTCGKEVLKKHIKIASVEYILDNIIRSNLNSTSILYYPEVIRNYFLKCSMCKISILKCRGRLISKKYTCREKIAEFVIYKNETVVPEYRDMLKYAVKNITPYLAQYDGSPSIRIQKRDTVDYPISVHIPIGGLNITRPKRHSDKCHYPNSLQLSDLMCIHYPSKVTCFQRCAFGHTVKEVVRMEYLCLMKENRWRPHNFQDCQPYVDCTLSLTTGGKATCKTPTLHHGPVCSVKCYEYEDKPGVRIRNYQCDIHGRWFPSLPFCATAGSGIHLVPPPTDE